MSCNFSKDWSPWFNPACWLEFLGALITSLFLAIGVMFLQLAGFLFNFLLNYTVVEFKVSIYDKIGSSIEIGWTAFRDIANILIIGMFTFIAISIILGEKTFGQKKLIAKVLIIAVLINFSLLFTKMIIDASNFTATQFYRAALGQVASTPVSTSDVTLAAATGGTPAVTAPSSSNGIAGQFLQTIGMTGAFDSLAYIRNEQLRTNSGPLGVGFGILALIFFLGATVVLFYGCFLLVSRAILLIFLMITASLAFASYLIPVWETSSYGWKTWWSSLLKSAVFAPILMLFLWITLMIAQQLKIPSTANATLGGAGSDPGGNVAAVASYLMILGMLFLSFKLSSSFAGKIAGFNWAATVPAIGIGLGARVAGFVGRKTIGAGAGYVNRRLKTAAVAQNKAGNVLTAKGILGVANQFGKVTKKDFNVMNTRFGNQISATAGLKGKWAGETKLGGTEGVEKKLAERYAKDAESLQVSAEQKKKIREEAEQNIRSKPEKIEERDHRKRMEKTAEAELEQAKKTRDENKKGHDEALETAKKQVETVKSQTETNKKAIEESSNAIITRLERDKEYIPEGTKGRKDMEDQIVAARADRDSRMNAEQANIDKAQAKATQVAGLGKADVDAVEAATAKHKSAIAESQKFEKGIKDETEVAVKLKHPNLDKSTGDIAAQLANTRATNLFGAGVAEENDHLAKLARTHARESAEDRSLKRIFGKPLEDMKKSLEDISEENKLEAELKAKEPPADH